MGGILDGMPSMIKIDFDRINEEMARRAPGRQPGTSARREPDLPEFLSGFDANGMTLGTPIGFIVRNKDGRSSDYAGYVGKFRPNHADYTYFMKYGIHDFRGGGRSSARETVSWVVAGAICRQLLEKYGVEVKGWFEQTNPVNEIASQRDSTGGIVRCEISGLPVGVGDPVFDKLHARLAMAMMSINAAKAFEYGDGFKSAYSKGSEVLDIPEVEAPEGRISFKTNHSGGIQGGISNGMPVNFSVYFKPTPTLMQTVDSVDVNGRKTVIEPRGRHDACVAVRAVPVVEAMALLTVADLMKGVKF